MVSKPNKYSLRSNKAPCVLLGTDEFLNILCLLDIYNTARLLEGCTMAPRSVIKPRCLTVLKGRASLWANLPSVHTAIHQAFTANKLARSLQWKPGTASPNPSFVRPTWKNPTLWWLNFPLLAEESQDIIFLFFLILQFVEQKKIQLFLPCEAPIYGTWVVCRVHLNKCLAISMYLYIIAFLQKRKTFI